MESVSTPHGGEDGAVGVEVWVGVWVGARCGGRGKGETSGLCGLDYGMAEGYDGRGCGDGLRGDEWKRARLPSCLRHNDLRICRRRKTGQNMRRVTKYKDLGESKVER